MKENKIVLWLICFFPVGLYLMYKYSKWPLFLKHLITGLGIFLSGLLISSGKTFDFLVFIGVFLMFFGLAKLIFSIFTKKNKKTAGLLILYGLIFIFIGDNQLNKQEQAEKEQIVLEQKVTQEKRPALEKKRIKESRYKINREEKLKGIPFLH